jgi:dihydroorotate dehydrogenase (NAD+) catalytic subunit
MNGACPAMDAGVTRDIVSGAKSRSRRPLLAKLSPNVTDIASIARAAEDGGADGISLINTLLAMAVDLDSRRPKLGNLFGGLSGPAIKPVALRMVYQVSRAVRIPVIGMGGITSGRDALEFLLVGARAVQVGTANFVDPGASVRIVREMNEECDARGIARVSDIVGTLKT